MRYHQQGTSYFIHTNLGGYNVIHFRFLGFWSILVLWYRTKKKHNNIKIRNIRNIIQSLKMRKVKKKYELTKWNWKIKTQTRNGKNRNEKQNIWKILDKTQTQTNLA